LTFEPRVESPPRCERGPPALLVDVVWRAVLGIVDYRGPSRG